MSKPLVSIVVRTKDRPQLLRCALNSIAQQTYKPIEAVVVNDGGCNLDLEKLKADLNNVALKYIHLRENVGRAKAANVGISNCTGEYIGFLDDDDELCPEHVYILVTALENSDCNVVYANTEIVYKEIDETTGSSIEKSRRLFSSRDFSYEDLLVGNYIPFNSLLFRKTLLDSVGNLDDGFELYEDWDLLIRCAQRGPFVHIDQRTSIYNQWDEEKQIAQKSDNQKVKEHYYKIIQKYSFHSLPLLCDRYIRATTSLAEKDRVLQEVHRALAEKDRVLQEVHRALAEKDRVLQEVHRALAEKDRVLQEVHRALAEKDRVLQEVHRALAEKDRVLQEVHRALAEKDRILQDTKNALIQAHNTLTIIQDSLGWQLLNLMARQRDRLFPADTLRRKYLNRFIRAIKMLKNEGTSSLIRKIRHREQDLKHSGCDQGIYEKWIDKNEKRSSTHEGLKSYPIIVIYMLSDCPSEDAIKKGIESTLNQSYEKWSLLITTDDKLLSSTINQTFTDDRIKILQVSGGTSIVEVVNKSLMTLVADYLLFMKAADVLSPNALYEIAYCINNYPESEIIYSDEDCFDGQKRHNPFFKPDWNPDMLRAFNYIGTFFAIKRGLFEKIGGVKEYTGDSIFYDLLIRSAEHSSDIFHIPKVLYHRRCSKPEAERLAIRSTNANRIKKAIFGNPMPNIRTSSKYEFSIIILNKNSPHLIIPLVEFLRKNNRPGFYQIIIGDTGSDNMEVLSYYDAIKKDSLIIRDIRYHFSSNYNYLITNFAEGETVGIVNNDIILQDMDFLAEASAFLSEKDSGALGFKLLYPDGNLQHSGVFFFEDTELRGLPYHRYHGKPQYFLQDTKEITIVPAVTGAFMFCRREDFIRLGGFDTNYIEEAQDIDLCLKLTRVGKEIGFASQHNIVHIENGTRTKGSSNSNDRNYFLWKWSSFLEANILNQDINRCS